MEAISFNLEIPDWKIRNEIERQLFIKMQEELASKVVIIAESIDTDDMAKEIAEQIADASRGYELNKQMSQKLAEILDAKLETVVSNITDEELKNILLTRLMTKIQ